MRQGVGAGFPHHDDRRRVTRGDARTAEPVLAPASASAQARLNIAKLFWDLRTALRVTPHQLAAHILTRVEVIEALETGQFEFLPQWPETARIVMAYTALAGIDGRPVLAALADVMRAAQAAAQPVRQNSTRSVQVERLRQAGTAFANGAKRLPAGAIKQVRERPERAFYAVSMPLAAVFMLLNTSALQAAFDHIPRPVASLAHSVRQYFQVNFAPVHEGLRWIEVDDPRRRRGDKLRQAGQSD
jgi:hypothetical protein